MMYSLFIPHWPYVEGRRKMRVATEYPNCIAQHSYHICTNWLDASVSVGMHAIHLVPSAFGVIKN